MKKHHIEVVGHRGAAAVEPENTLKGFQYALSLHVDRVEIDVHLTSDQELVVMHDLTVERTTNGVGKIADLTLSEIKQLDAGKGERVPTLQEVIELFQQAWNKGSKTRLQIELKGEGTASPTVEAVKRSGIEKHVVLSSFKSDYIAEAHRLMPDGTFGFITSSLVPDPIETALAVNAAAVHLRHNLATHENVEQIRAAGLEIVVWNIDEAERMKWAIDLGVDGIGSNDPALLLEVLAQN